jgi:hypothetical protein
MCVTGTTHHWATEMCVTGHNTPLSHWNVCDWTQHTTEPLKCVWLDTTHHWATEICVTGHNTPLRQWNVCDLTQHTTVPLKCDWTQHTTEPLQCAWPDTPPYHCNVCVWTQHTTLPLQCVWPDTTHHPTTAMWVTGHNTPLCHRNVGELDDLFPWDAVELVGQLLYSFATITETIITFQTTNFGLFIFLFKSTHHLWTFRVLQWNSTLYLKP